MTKKKYTMVVLTNAKQGQDDEFNDWYNNQHIQDVLAIPGFTAAQRFEFVEKPGVPVPQYKYCANYEMETDDPGAVVTELFRRHGTPQLAASDAMDPTSYFALYEAITPVVKK